MAGVRRRNAFLPILTVALVAGAGVLALATGSLWRTVRADSSRSSRSAGQARSRRLPFLIEWSREADAEIAAAARQAIERIHRKAAAGK